MAEKKNQLSPVDTFKVVLQKQYYNQVKNFLAGDETRTLKFMSSAMSAINKIPELLNCERDSLFQSLLTAAELGLDPSGVSGECYIIPYKGKAQFQLGYQGMITLLYRAGIGSISTDIVYENDEFTYEAGLNPVLIHKPNVFGDRGKVLGVYAIVTLETGQRLFKVMSEFEILKYKEFSQSKASQYSPWQPKNDPDKTMYRKTVIKQLYKLLPKNPIIDKAIQKDNEDSIIHKQVEESKLAMGNFLQLNEKDSKESSEKDSKEVTPFTGSENGEETITIE